MTVDKTGSDDPAVGATTPAAPSHAAQKREDRRKAALKANMARRKDQARLRAAQRQAGDDADAQTPDVDK